MDAAAVSRARSHGVDLEVKYSHRFPTGPNGEHLPSYLVAEKCTVTGTDEQRQAALADLERLQEPAPTETVEDWLAELSVLTAGRGKEGLEAALLVNAYASRLRQFPADVARHALLGKTWKWFPTWHELELVCKAAAGPRNQMIHALRNPQELEPEYRQPTPEERARMSALVAKKFPNVPQEWRDQADRMLARSHIMEAAE